MNVITKLFLIIFLNCCLSFYCGATTYIVDPINGNDANPGTSVNQPFKTISMAITKIKPGDTTYLRGGTYLSTQTISIGTSRIGRSDAYYYMLAYPGERPVLDFSSMAISSSNRGISLKGGYWYIKGIDIKGAGDNGMIIEAGSTSGSGSHNIIEFCSFYENHDTGLQISNGAAYNRVINCDSYYNSDPSQGNADGFAPKLTVGTGNYFYGCRSWQNSDDGWDGYMRVDVGADTVTTTLENCWCFKNGYLKNGSVSSGNGNGFKMGGSDNKNLRHNFILKNCISFDNLAKGFDQNNNKGSMTLLNCTGYRNGTNYGMSSVTLSSECRMTIKNCISLPVTVSILPNAIQNNNSWLASFSVSESDFISLDPAEAYGARKQDGSLPDIQFLHLAESSKLVDAGVETGLPFIGAAPDLGAFESPWGVSVPVELISFTASTVNNKVELKWKTATELDNLGFVIERKNIDEQKNLSDWQNIGFIKSIGTSNLPQEYSYVDKPLEGRSFVYRLKQIDLNGRYKYYNEINVSLAPYAFHLKQNYPNPFNPVTTINFQIPQTVYVQLKIYDALGRQIFTLVNEEKAAGNYSVSFDASSLSSGTYYYRIVAGDYSNTRKMQVLK